MFEYTIYVWNGKIANSEGLNEKDLIMVLNRYGLEGWELISTIHFSTLAETRHYFKRWK